MRGRTHAEHHPDMGGIRPTEARIDLRALACNFRRLRETVGPRVGVIAVVKADAYGHGAAPVARLLEGLGVRAFGVSTVEEGVELRQAGIRAPVLIMGESGVGKEMIAHAIHAQACSLEPTVKKPFIVVNCPAIPDALLESEMFGYQRGAFTGATRDHKGKVLLADGGTLFLDEVGDLPLTLQPKLLRVLEDKSFQPVGSNATVRVNARVICTTNRDLEQAVTAGTFRRDLFYRINALIMRLAPLRERKADIRPLVDHFLQRYSLEMRKEVRVSADVLEAFQEYPWPGNVRELRNVVERAVVIVNSGEEIGLRDLPPEMSHDGRSAEPSRENRLETQERALIMEALHQSGWNISRAAQALGIPRGNLRYRIDKFGLTKGENPPPR